MSHFDQQDNSDASSEAYINEKDPDPVLNCYNDIVRLFRKHAQTTMICMGWKKDPNSDEYIHRVEWGVKNVTEAKLALQSHPEIDSTLVDIIQIYSVDFQYH